MRLHPQLAQATFIERANRFAALMRLNGRDVMVHIAHSGRIRELLTPENRMFVSPARNTKSRKTSYDLALTEVGGVLVSADALVPNTLLREAIESARIPEFAGYDALEQEVRFGDSRVDLVLRGASGVCYIEAKSVTPVEDGVGLFPDAPTERGRKHVLSLIKAVGMGHRAAVVFVVQRPDVRAFSPNRRADPRFCQVLEDAVAEGVEVYAFRCAVSRSRIDITDALPVRLR